MMIAILVKNFQSRNDLEEHIKKNYGSPPPEDVVILGEESLMKKFQLSETSKVYGIKCEVIPDPVPVKLGVKSEKKAVKIKINKKKK